MKIKNLSESDAAALIGTTIGVYRVIAYRRIQVQKSSPAYPWAFDLKCLICGAVVSDIRLMTLARWEKYNACRCHSKRGSQFNTKTMTAASISQNLTKLEQIFNNYVRGKND